MSVFKVLSRVCKSISAKNKEWQLREQAERIARVKRAYSYRYPGKNFDDLSPKQKRNFGLSLIYEEIYEEETMAYENARNTYADPLSRHMTTGGRVAVGSTVLCENFYELDGVERTRVRNYIHNF